MNTNTVTFWLFVAFVSWIFSQESMGCGVISARRTGMFFFTSYESGASESYGPEGDELQVSACGPEDRGKYIMLAMGPDIISRDYHRSNSYSGSFLDDHCSIADSPLDPSRTLSYQQRLAYYQKQTKALQTCMEAVVVDHSRLGISFPDTQAGCTVTRTGLDSVVAQGGYCFFRINPDSDFSVKYRVRPECADTTYLKQKNIQPLDFNNGVSVYVAGDTSGHSTDLTHLEMLDTRFTIQAASNIFGLSTNFGPDSPRWPATWNADVHMGDFKIKANNFPEIEASFLVDNQCTETCKDGVCTSPCDFMIPGAAEGSLFKLPSGAPPKLLDIWYQGAIVPAKWQGFVPGETHSLGMQPFVVGGRYRLSFKFAYPDTYYRLAKDGFRQFLIKLNMLRPGDNSVHPLPPLDPMTGISALYKSLPDVKPLPGLVPNIRSIETTWREPLATMASYLNFEGWPPYYEQVCPPSGDHCGSIYKGAGHTTVSIDFTIKSLAAPTYEVQDLVYRRESDVLAPYERAVAKAPHLECN